MSNAEGSHQISESIHQRLLVHQHRLQDVHRASQVYSDFLLDAERESVGPFDSAYSYATDRTIGMWVRAKNVSRNRAIIDLARLFGLPEGEYLALLRGIGEAPSSNPQRPYVPFWNPQTLELSLDGQIVKRINGRATNHFPILDSFQEEGWPSRIDDPLDPSSDGRRLTDALRRLNKGLLSMRFSRDGSGTGIRWQRVSAPN